jgi:hypothetical protein
MRETASLFPIIAGALLAFGCTTENDNPYAALEHTRPIPSWADVLLTSNLHAPGEGAPREVFALSSSDGRLEQLTFPNAAHPMRDYVQISPISDAGRIVLLERTAEIDSPYSGDPAGSAVFLDLTRGVRSDLSSAGDVVTSVDASPVASLVVFSTRGTNGKNEILWRELSSTNVTSQALTQTPEIDERHPRFDRGGRVITFERNANETPSEIWLLFAVNSGNRITEGGPAGSALPETPYRVGSDADPCFSPDNYWVVFRRLTSVGDGRHGDWEILVVDSNGDNAPSSIVTGARYRGAPDWDSRGIVFTEWDSTSNRWSVVVVDPDGSNRRSVLEREAPIRFDSPRWIP